MPPRSWAPPRSPRPRPTTTSAVSSRPALTSPRVASRCATTWFAMTFIIFDIEVVFMYPWAVSFNQLGLFGLVVMMSFLVTLCVPYAYEWRRGGLDY